MAASGDMSHLELKVAFGHHRKISDSAEFKAMTKMDACSAMSTELDKLLRTAPEAQLVTTKAEFAGFERLYGRFMSDSTSTIAWDRIEPLPATAIKEYKTLPEPADAKLKEMLSKLVVVKLNGGLGTSMGCQGPKSAIPVRNDLTFLDLTVQQIEYLNKTYDCEVPLVLMNSFNTDEDTNKILRKYKGFKVQIFTFLQSRYPRINKETLMPITTSLMNPGVEDFYPPGHGDFYESFVNSGLAEHFLKEKREYVFISNIDNLGATVDLNILNCLLHPTEGEKPEFVMEVTEKTRADVKGGTLIGYEKRLRLLEIAQVPLDHVDEFKSVKKFKIFNTNNLWIRLDRIKQAVETHALSMEIIINHKHLDDGTNIVQLETAAGSAIKDFSNSFGINVPRSRFLPVKKTSDLMLAMSNLYAMRNGSLQMSPLRAFPTVPLIKLGDGHFAKVREFLKRFASIPDILELDHLTVSGDVTFGKGVVLRGTVIVIANHGDRIDIPPGAILENKIMSGNLRILDH
ncbi:UTP--glucose-1-phosphate uridylyltransferase [Galendromus occidentalis]|uniref:UTP--glucose-1-phosphate uridylyltransferase n=1 Tax=Galendromus occidentalis TaxID=34638 RepID=A0AAJ6VWR1_9ACAR|nr:UTP--glucose-1-phosphate uridylyltransferase [Galendromus occidentalis]XP_003740716.1 UTP--glucose-1-phosphate uridylyltransferase [Galendromus occidentalis]